MGGESLAVVELGEAVEEAQASGLMSGAELLQNPAPEQPREHANGEEEAGPARDPLFAIG